MYKGYENFSSVSEKNSDISVEIQGGRAEVSDVSFIRDADFSRDGADLMLDGPDGVVRVEGYFLEGDAPVIVGPDGSALSPALVSSFLQSGSQYAQISGASDVSAVGSVDELSGEVILTRVDGTQETATIGSPVYEGDVIETSGDGAANIVFVDETSFAVSENARLSIDEYVFDPDSNEGSTDFSVLKGLFVFTSGLVGRDDPDDVTIETPMGSIGIRGTIIAGNVDNGEITVVEGAIVLRDLNGNEVTLADQFETAKFNSAGEQIEHIGVMRAEDVSANFESVSGVSGDLFSSIQDTMRDVHGVFEADDAGASDEAVQGEESGDGAVEVLDGEDHSDVVGEQDILIQDASADEGVVHDMVARNDEVHEELMQKEWEDYLYFANTGAVQSETVSFVNESFAALGLNAYDPGEIRETHRFNSDLLVFGDPDPSVLGLLLAESSVSDSVPNSDPQALALEVPDSYFSSIAGRTFTYDFSDSFFDAEGDALTYTLNGQTQADFSDFEDIGVISFFDLNPITGVLTVDFSLDIGAFPFSNFGVVATDESGDTGELAPPLTLLSSDGILDNDNELEADQTVFEEGALDHSLAGNGKTVFLKDDVSDDFTVEGRDNLIYMNEARSSVVGNEGRTVLIQDGADNTTVFGGLQNDRVEVAEATDLEIYTVNGNDTVDIDLSQVGATDLDGAIIRLGSETSSWAKAFAEGNINAGGFSDGDTLALSGSGSIDFFNVNNLTGVETLDAKSDIAGQIINLTLENVFGMTDAENVLLIKGDSSDALNVYGGLNDDEVITQNGNIFIDTDGDDVDEQYDIWEGVDSGGNAVTLLVESGIVVDPVAVV